MTERTASCPSCGAEIRFRSAATTMAVCGSCGVGAWRTDVSVESLGRVSDVVEIQSVVGLGARGTLRKVRFIVLGQLQLDQGAGPWNEWFVVFEDRRTAWLAEAQGQLYLTEEVEGFEPPASLEIRPGKVVKIGATPWSVAEAGTARVVAARGELPSPLAAGDTYRYLDVRGSKSRFGTISENPRTKRVEAFVGTEVQSYEITVDAASLPPAPPRKVRADRFACPQCGGALTLRDPAGTMRIVCEGCGSLVDPTSERVRVVGKGMELEARPQIPLGAKGTLRGEEVTVLAYMVRSVTSGGERFPWSEYLLRTKDGAYRWLVVSKGHWVLATPANPADWLSGAGVRSVDGEYRHFQGGDARVDHVQGELYWTVRVGDLVDADDFIRLDPETGEVHGVSRERSPGEVVCSTCVRVPRDEVIAAFGGDLDLRPERGVSMLSPNPWVRPCRNLWRAAKVLALAFAAAFVVVQASLGGDRVTSFSTTAVWEGAPPVAATPEAAPPPPGAADAARERGVAFSDEFDLAADPGNVVVDLSISGSNTWVGVDGALVEVNTGEVHGFTVEAEQWSGVSGGESWSEGSGRGSARIGNLPAGRYALRTEAVWAGLTPPQDLQETRSAFVAVRAEVPSRGLPWIVLVLVLAPPAFVWFARQKFETERWAESDHAE